ncbi:MAG: leucine dehydrogenase [Thermoanaerobaculia bacterium]|nr:leucine dehydrogenase [Thermoanaerobaculia bacterium]
MADSTPPIRAAKDDILPLIETWDGESFVIRFDEETGTWIFLALHSSVLGRPSGGTRMKVYEGLRDAVLDSMRLARGMTAKWAGLDMDIGGGKAVLAIPGPLEGAARDGLLRRYGDLIHSLSGAFATGADLGTTAADMATIARSTHYVFGVDHETGESTDPGPFTARGVFEGLRASVESVFGDAIMAGRSVLVQGVGGVGRPLSHLLAEAGADVFVSDLDAGRAAELAREVGGREVDPDDALSYECDVFAPCAVGGILSRYTIQHLHCRIVAGSANNQLQEDEDAQRLHERGIVYAPDYILNAGGAMALALMADGLTDRDVLLNRVAAIGQVVGEILSDSAEHGTTPLEAASRIVERRLAVSS